MCIRDRSFFIIQLAGFLIKGERFGKIDIHASAELIEDAEIFAADTNLVVTSKLIIFVSIGVTFLVTTAMFVRGTKIAAI